MVKLFKVVLSENARKRLAEIFGYYKRNASRSTAQKVHNRILDTAQSLERFPESKPILPGTENDEYPKRYTKAWSFKIIFTIFQKRRQVNVIDIYHDKQDPENAGKA